VVPARSDEWYEISHADGIALRNENAVERKCASFPMMRPLQTSSLDLISSFLTGWTRCPRYPVPEKVARITLVAAMRDAMQSSGAAESIRVVATLSNVSKVEDDQSNEKHA
jgi:hypothetical protein